MISNVCLKLKISESLFQGEGSIVPLTIKEALIYMKNMDNNTEIIPVHIKNFLNYFGDCIEVYNDYTIIKKVEVLWLVSELEKELKTINNINYDIFYNCVVLCLENYDSYKRMGESFIQIMQYKINDIIRYKQVVNRNNRLLYEKSLELQQLHIYDNLVDPKSIKDEFKNHQMG